MGICIAVFVMQVEWAYFVFPKTVFFTESNPVRKFIVAGGLFFPQIAAGTFVIVYIFLAVIAFIINEIMDNSKINAVQDFGVFPIFYFDGDDTGAVLSGSISVFCGVPVDPSDEHFLELFRRKQVRVVDYDVEIKIKADIC